MTKRVVDKPGAETLTKILAENLVDFLNNYEFSNLDEALKKKLITSPRERQRVVEFLSVLRRLNAIPPPRKKVLIVPAEFKQLSDRFDAMAKLYPGIPDFYYGSDPHFRLIPSRRPLRRVHEQEWEAIHLVTECQGNGTLDKIRECICGRWFFARRSDQNSCGSPLCRHRRYEQTEPFKKKRAMYMRWRYAMNASKKWASTPPRKRPTFPEWKQYNEPTPTKWLAIVQLQKKGA